VDEEAIGVPRIISLAMRLEPDHSGGCCPICAGGSSRDAYCDFCGGKRFERKEVFEFAQRVDRGAHVCDSCVFQVRDSSGKKLEVCWLCLKEKYDIAKLRECPECLIFDDFEGDTCDWCRDLGPLWSVLHASGVPSLTQEEKSVYERFLQTQPPSGGVEGDVGFSSEMLEELEKKRLIRRRQCGARLEWSITHGGTLSEWLWERERKEGRPTKLSVDGHYDALVDLLRRDDFAEAVFNYIIRGDEECEEYHDFITNELSRINMFFFEGQGAAAMASLASTSAVAFDNPKFGDFFKAIHDEDYRAQIDFLLKMPTIPDYTFHLFGKGILTREEFEDFLLRNEELPPEFRVRVLASVWLPDEKDFNQSRWDLFGQKFPQELATTIACEHVLDPRDKDYDNWMSHGASFSPDVRSRLLSLMAADSLMAEDKSTEYPIVNQYAERGTGLAKILGRLLSGKKVEFEAPLTERLVWMIAAIGIDDQVLSAFSESLADYSKQDMKERIIESEDRSYRNKFLEAMYSVEHYEEFLEFSETPFLSHSLVHGERYLRAGVRTGKYDLVESQINGKLAHHREEISKLEALEACRRDFQILNAKFDMVFCYLALNLKEDAQRTLDEAIRYLKDLIGACKESNLPFSTYQWVLSCIDEEGLTDDPEIFFDAVNKAHFLEISWDNPGPCTAYWSKGLGEDRIRGVQLTRDFHESLLELVIELSQAFSERSGVS
jgi:hypothetical protein